MCIRRNTLLLIKNSCGISTIKKELQKFRKCDFDLNDKTCPRRPQETKDVQLQDLLDDDATQFTCDLAGQSIDNTKKANPVFPLIFIELLYISLVTFLIMRLLIH